MRKNLRYVSLLMSSKCLILCGNFDNERKIFLQWKLQSNNATNLRQWKMENTPCLCIGRINIIIMLRLHKAMYRLSVITIKMLKSLIRPRKSASEIRQNHKKLQITEAIFNIKVKLEASQYQISRNIIRQLQSKHADTGIWTDISTNGTNQRSQKLNCLFPSN